MSNTSFEAISKAVTEGEDVEAERLVQQALDEKLPPLDILQKGVVSGITKAGELWKENKYFLPDVILAADAFKAAMRPLEPRLKELKGGRPKGKFVIGVVEGDMHDLGKSLVGAMLTSASFEVIDLGIDTTSNKFIQAVQEHKPDIIGMGAYTDDHHAADENHHRRIGKARPAQEFEDHGRRCAHQPGIRRRGWRRCLG